jgi:hypothetical protein
MVSFTRHGPLLQDISAPSQLYPYTTPQQYQKNSEIS